MVFVITWLREEEGGGGRGGREEKVAAEVAEIVSVP